MKFKTPIEVQAGISDGDPTNPLGQAGYLLSSDGSNVNWVSPGGLSAETAEAIVQPIKADEALVKGDPLYIVGYQTGQDVNIVAKADSSDAAKMPVVGLADDDYANQAFGTMTAFGSFNGDFDTTGPGTESWTIGDIIFVKPGGGLTNIKPGGTDLIQNVAIVSRVNSQTGELEVIALGRTNDVPNLPEGRLFVGTATNTSLTSDVVYVDDTNDRVGINTAMPTYDLDVDGAIRASEGFIDNEDNSALRVVSPPGGSFRSAFTTVGAIEVTIPNSYVKNDVTFTLEVREGSLTAYTIKIAMRGNIGIDLFPYIVSAYLTSDANKDNNCTIKYESLVPEFDDVKIYVQNPSLGFPSNTGVFITEFTVPATVADGNLAWGLNITSVPAEANATFSNTQVTNWKRNGQDLYYGSGSGNVGIGKTNPGAKLEVVGTTGVIIDSGTSAQAKLTLIGDGSPFGGGASIDVIGGSTDYLSYGLNIKNSPSTLEASNSYFQYNAGWMWNGNQSNTRTQPYTSYDFRSQSSSQMVIYNNNLGIGVTTPSQKLHVNGNARVTGSYYDSSNSPGAANSVLISTISGTVWGARGPLGGGTTNYLARWTPDGNTLGIGVTYDNGTSVGIGTTSPGTYKLAVAGSTAIGENLEVSDGLGGDKTLSIDATVGTFQIGDIDGIGDEAYVEGDSSSIKIFTGGGETLVCDINQRVGIGTNIPQAKLHVQNYTTGESHQAMFKGGSVNIGDYSYISLNGGYASDYGKEVRLAAVSESAFGNTTGFAVLTSPDSSGASGHERLRVTADGNVGIGTPIPGAKLDVVQSTAANGAAALHLIGPQSNPGLTSSVLIIEQSDGKKITIDGNDIDVSSGDLFINDYSREDVTFGGQIKVTGGGSPVGDSYFANGNVGVGTTNPNAKLEISGHSNSGKFLLIDNVALGDTFLNVEDGVGSQLLQIKRETDNTISFNSYNDFNFIDNVGIKQTNPLHPLDVNGEIHSSTYVSATAGLGVDNTIGTLGRGISLYSGPSLYPQYGLLFAQTVDLGTYGGVSGDWATYMTMSGTATRGWIWKAGPTNSTAGNVASISGVGQLTLASTATATNFILSSDKTLKDNIKEIDTKHVDVDWKNFELKSEPGVKRAGVIAQELEIKHPEFVRTADDGLKSVAYIDLLITKIAELEARLEKLEK
jgi:hypothetical protein